MVVFYQNSVISNVKMHIFFKTFLNGERIEAQLVGIGIGFGLGFGPTAAFIKTVDLFNLFSAEAPVMPVIKVCIRFALLSRHLQL